MASSISELAPVRWFYRNVVSEPLNLILLVGGVALAVGLIWKCSCRNQKEREVEPIDLKRVARLGGEQIQEGNFEQGVVHLELVLSHYRQMHGSTAHLDTILTLSNLGCGYVDLKEYSKALAVLQEALSMQTELKGKEANPLLAAIYHNLGDAQVGLGQYDEGIESYRSALAIHEQLYPDQYDDHFALTLENLGGLYAGLKQTDEALNIYQRLNRFYLLGGKEAEAAEIANKYHRLKMPNYQSTVAAYEESYPNEYNQEFAAHLEALGQIYLQLEWGAEALNNYQRLHQLYLLGEKTEEAQAAQEMVEKISQFLASPSNGQD